MSGTIVPLISGLRFEEVKIFHLLENVGPKMKSKNWLKTDSNMIPLSRETFPTTRTYLSNTVHRIAVYKTYTHGCINVHVDTPIIHATYAVSILYGYNAYVHKESV